MRSLPVALWSLVLLLAASPAQETLPLINPSSPEEGWNFNNGQEFPGATGELRIDPEARRAGKATLKLIGDFTGGGGYVQAGKRLENVPINELSFWVRSPETDRFTLRLGDASGQTHQIVLKIEPGADWQRVTLPLQEFFANRGKANALTNIARYQSWGGAKDGNWHGPARGIYLLLSKGPENTVRNLWLNDIIIEQPPTAVAGAELERPLPLDEIVEGYHDWDFSLGKEYPGAKGALEVVEAGSESGAPCLKLNGDFTQGGAYVAMIRDLEGLGAADVTGIRMRVRTATAKSLTVKLIDSTGQTHQRKGLPVQPNGEWQDFVLNPEEIAGGEHWAGANDGKWHGPPQKVVISLAQRAALDDQKAEVHFADIHADAVLPVFAQPAAFQVDFERTSALEEWDTTGDVAIQEGRLGLSRTLENVNMDCRAIGPQFVAAPGQWEIAAARQSQLHSPDNSYSGVVQVECLDVSGEILERFRLVDVFGDHDWERVSQVAEFPPSTSAARFRVELNKTHGEFRVDDLSAAYLAPAPQRDDRIRRLLFSSDRLGNLLYPEDPRTLEVEVITSRPLREDQVDLAYVVRDYWGSEQTAPATVKVGEPERQDGDFIYRATLDLNEVPLEVGRYYEVHATIPAESSTGDARVVPFQNHTGLAILPEAITRQYDPMEIPFTSRNWDNRVPEFIRLTDRLGIRICGLWGGWSSEPPYKPQAPGLELCRELGMGWLTTTPIKFIERGNEEYDEQALRQGVRNFLEAYGDEKPLIINLGNEPHGTGERVRKNVEAYRIVYEEIKKVDPSIPVVATSVEPNEEYFENGYGKYCDAYDFHIYESHTKVRRNMQHYQELARKYDVVKPIWSTELGLNSQGQPRHAVAVELFRKVASFFAEGGANMSWFALVYPDKDGKSAGSSGDSHNVFDSRFNRYNPRLDAVAYYHAVNAVAIKKFVGERQYENGIHAFLFRDKEGKTLQILWNTEGRADVQLPMSGVGEVEMIRVDGRRRFLNAEQKGITLSVSTDPVLLLYDDAEGGLAAELGAPVASILTAPELISRAEPTEIMVDSGGYPVDVIAPPFWEVQSSEESGDQVRFTLTPPADSEVREGDFLIPLGDGTGELSLRIPME